MSSPDVREVLGILGGTGPQGRGLAARWARAGHVVHIGSRTQEKARAAVDDVRERAGDGVEVHPGTNDRVAELAEIVVVAMPFKAQSVALPPLADACAGKVVCNVVNPMVFDELGPKAVPVEEGSAAEECQALMPDARVVVGLPRRVQSTPAPRGRTHRHPRAHLWRRRGGLPPRGPPGEPHRRHVGRLLRAAADVRVRREHHAADPHDQQALQDPGRAADRRHRARRRTRRTPTSPTSGRAGRWGITTERDGHASARSRATRSR